MRKKINVLMSACFAMSIIACNKSQEDTAHIDKGNKEPYHILKSENNITGFLSQYYGFHQSSIKETEDAFVVSGDITFPKENFWTVYGLNEKQTTLPRALSYWKKVTNDQTYYLDIVTNKSAINDDWEQAVKDAAADYNALGLGIKFVVSTGSSANTVIIRVGSTSGGVPAEATWPSSTGTIGKYITISTTANTYASSYNRKRIMMHEMGHQVGLVHPGDTGTKVITGNSTCDNYSDASTIMKPGLTTLFTDCDKKTLLAMYPL